MKYVWRLLCAWYIIFICGCDDTLESTVDSVNVAANSKLGSQWCYEVLDHLNVENNDTLKITVFAIDTLANSSSCKCEVYSVRNNAIVDTIVYESTVDRYAWHSSHPDVDFDRFYIELPLRVGNLWTYTSSKDTVKILSFNKDVNVSDGKYDVYVLRRSLVEPGYSLVEMLTINKATGILRMTINEFSGAPSANKTITLVSYRK